jgi:hypothetical protein
VTLDHESQRTSTESRERAPWHRSMRRIAPVGLPQAIVAWRWRGTDGSTTSLSSAAPLLALPIPGEEVRQEPLRSLRASWWEGGPVKRDATIRFENNPRSPLASYQHNTSFGGSVLSRQTAVLTVLRLSPPLWFSAGSDRS